MMWYQQVSVYPRVEQPENPNSYKARKREYFRLQRERKKARKEGVVSPQLVLASSEEASVVSPVCWWICHVNFCLKVLLLFICRSCIVKSSMIKLRFFLHRPLCLICSATASFWKLWWQLDGEKRWSIIFN